MLWRVGAKGPYETQPRAWSCDEEHPLACQEGVSSVWRLDSCASAAMTEDCKRVAYTTDVIVSRFWRPEVQDRGVSRAGSLLGPEGSSGPCLSPGFWWGAGQHGGPELLKAASDLCFMFTWPPPCVCVCPNSPFMRCPPYTPHFNVVTTVKTLPPNQTIFWGLGLQPTYKFMCVCRGAWWHPS